MMREPSSTAPRAGVPLLAQMLLCSLLWASAFLVMKRLGSEIPPLSLTAIRGVMGGSLLALWCVVQRQSILPRGREWRDWAVLGVLQGVVPNSLTAFALTQITATVTSMIQATSPLIVALLAHLLFREERLSRQRGMGVLVGFAGMAILLGPAALNSGSGTLAGTLAMVGTALSYAAGSLYVRSIPKADPARLALGQQMFSGFPLLAAVLLAQGPAAFAAAGSHVALLVAFGIFATALPIVLFMNILRTAGPTLGSMNGYLIPFWTILLGMGLLHETVGGREILGGLIALAGVVIVSLSRRGAAVTAGAARFGSIAALGNLGSRLNEIHHLTIAATITAAAKFLASLS